MDLIIFLKDGTQLQMRLYRLKKCGFTQKGFFIESYKEGRIEFPLDSLIGFKIDRSKDRSTVYEWDGVILNSALTILSKHIA